MTDRFDLEQGIVRAWGIVDDLKEAKDMEQVRAIAEYYSIRFDHLWETFEAVVAHYNFVERNKQGIDTY